MWVSRPTWKATKEMHGEFNLPHIPYMATTASTNQCMEQLDGLRVEARALLAASGERFLD